MCLHVIRIPVNKVEIASKMLLKYLYMAYPTSRFQIPTPKIFTNDMGSNTFQQTLINWSTRKRGNVQRNQIIKNINDMDLPINQKRPQDGLSIKPGIGLFQPPKNAATATPLTTNILAYSLKKKKA
jgi:hypothetical protein